MTDDSARAALRSAASLVVVEAPAGCGKTHQGADYAREVATAGKDRFLILTHTHAACSMFADRTDGLGSRLEINTIDSFIARVAAAYHAGLGLPADTATWVRKQENGHAHVAVKVAALLKRKPMIAAAMARRYPVVICDEHQDSSGDQHSVVMALRGQGARLRIFGDPMQNIFPKKTVEGAAPACDWDALKAEAEAFSELNVPHRWSSGCPDLGRWTLIAREALRSGKTIDLRSGLPSSISVVFAENQGHRHGDYQLSKPHRKPIDEFANGRSSLLILTAHTKIARSLRGGFFNRRIALWEGHVRDGLEDLTHKIEAANGDRAAVAAAGVEFMGKVGRGFSSSEFGDRLEKEARDGCVKQCRGKPATIQELARFLVEQPNHRGVAEMLRRLWELKKSDAAFAGVEIDCVKEFWDAVSLRDFDTADDGLAEITRRRSYSRPKPPDRAISTIHKAKGLECGNVIVMPCDASTFPDKLTARCLLYVALSRAKSRLMLVVSRASPSPLFEI